jgi:hypothetical protein
MTIKNSSMSPRPTHHFDSMYGLKWWKHFHDVMGFLKKLKETTEKVVDKGAEVGEKGSKKERKSGRMCMTAPKTPWKGEATRPEKRRAISSRV